MYMNISEGKNRCFPVYQWLEWTEYCNINASETTQSFNGFVIKNTFAFCNLLSQPKELLWVYRNGNHGLIGFHNTQGHETSSSEFLYFITNYHKYHKNHLSQPLFAITNHFSVSRDSSLYSFNQNFEKVHNNVVQYFQKQKNTGCTCT